MPTPVDGRKFTGFIMFSGYIENIDDVTGLQQHSAFICILRNQDFAEENEEASVLKQARINLPR
jgi:hypothetical protein